MQNTTNRIPVTIITGFLGAGKTTLLNRLIREYPDKKYAIIENEFGEIGIDSEMVINIDNNNICELANGCICCTLDVFRAGDVSEPATAHSITSHSYILPGAFDIEKFSYWMEYFLYINQSIMFRAKGILNFDSNPHKMILQSVRSSYLLEDGDYWDGGEKRINRIIFIGKDLNHSEIKEALENLMV